MTRTRWPLAALATVALIGAIGAGCGTDKSTDTSVASSTGVAGTTGTASATGGVKSTGNATNAEVAKDKRATDRDRVATPAPARSLPSRMPSSSSPGRLPSARPRQPATTGAPSPQPNSPQSPHDWRRHE